MASDLYMPGEFIEEILVKLPVKSLLRFKCVSKSCCSIITSPGFIANHLRNHKMEENGSLLVRNGNFDAQRYSFPRTDPDKTLMVPVFESLYLDLKSDAFQLGTCNGIFCVVNSFLELALWNPATREIRSISSDPYLTKDAYYFTRAFGFGLDLVTNDYKVVLIETVADEQMVDFDYSMVRNHTSVYSMRDDSWREFTGNFPKCF